jgi:hypothetical protein
MNRPPLVPLGVALLAMLGTAASTGLLVGDAAAQIARRREDDSESDVPLLMASPVGESDLLAGHGSHSSHASHTSHRSHYSGSGGGAWGGGGSGGDDTVAPAPPPPPQPARISIVAYPGGKISVDGRPVGRDATGVLTLAAGSHTILVENRFVGSETRQIDLQAGQTGVVEVLW